MDPGRAACYWHDEGVDRTKKSSWRSLAEEENLSDFKEKKTALELEGELARIVGSLHRGGRGGRCG